MQFAFNEYTDMNIGRTLNCYMIWTCEKKKCG